MIDCIEEVSHATSAFEPPVDATEEGLISRQIAEQPMDRQPNEGDSWAMRLSFPTIFDTDAQLVEIAPSGETEVHRHSYEAFFYVVAGAGSTRIDDGQAERRVRWRTGDLFATPRQTWHQHINDDPAETVRLLEITTGPLMDANGTSSVDKRDGKPKNLRECVFGLNVDD